MKRASPRKRYARAVKQGYAPQYSYGTTVRRPMPSIFGGDMIASIADLLMRRGR